MNRLIISIVSGRLIRVIQVGVVLSSHLPSRTLVVRTLFNDDGMSALNTHTLTTCLLALAITLLLLPSWCTAVVRWQDLPPLGSVGQHELRADMDGDGREEWIIIENVNIYVMSSEAVPRGLAYIRSAFPVHYAFAGAFSNTHRGVLCVVGIDRTDCLMMKDAGEKREGESDVVWLGQQSTFILPYAPEDQWPQLSAEWQQRHQARGTGQRVMVHDFNGDGRDEVLLYTPSSGTFSLYIFKSTSSTGRTSPGRLVRLLANQFSAHATASLDAAPTSQFQLLADIPVKDALVTTSYFRPTPMSLVYQQVIAGHFFDCSCPQANASARCNELARTTPVETLPLNYSPDSFAAADILLYDVSSGIVQVFEMCIHPIDQSFQLIRRLVTRPHFLRAGLRLSVANIRGFLTDELVVQNEKTGQIRVYAPTYHPTSRALQWVWLNLQEVEARSKSQGEIGVLLWCRNDLTPQVVSSKPVNDSIVLAEQTLSTNTSALLLSNTRRRSDPLLYFPSSRTFIYLAAEYHTNAPVDRLMDRGENQTVSVTDVQTRPTGGTTRMVGYRRYKHLYTQPRIDVWADQDNDAILGRYELGALDINKDGISEEPLHLKGASPFRKDVFIEVDWMESPSRSMRPLDGFADPAIDDLGNHNIALHVELGGPIEWIDNLGGQSFRWERDFTPLKTKYFTPTRVGLYHYCLFGHTINGGTVSGQSISVPGNDFLITLGGWDSGRGSLRQQQGTFYHELGHNLNLLHGGSDDVNWKPNHLSIMNYAYQITGVRKNGEMKMVLSDVDCEDLNEKNLNEFQGVRCKPSPHAEHAHDRFETMIQGEFHPLNTQIDFNKNGIIEQKVWVDLNTDSNTFLKGSPVEFDRMRFDGLDEVPVRSDEDVQGLAAGDRARTRHVEGVDADAASSSSSHTHTHSTRRLLEVKSQLMEEMTYEHYLDLMANR